MQFEINYRVTDWWTDHLCIEVRRTRDSREDRTVLSFTYRRRMPQKHQRRMGRYFWHPI